MKKLKTGSIVDYINEFIINNTHRVTMFFKGKPKSLMKCCTLTKETEQRKHGKPY